MHYVCWENAKSVSINRAILHPKKKVNGFIAFSGPKKKKMLFIGPGYHHPCSSRGPEAIFVLCSHSMGHANSILCNLESKHDALAGTFPLLE